MSESEEDLLISDLGLEELKRIYDNESERQRNLDTKSATILGFATLVVTILVFILKYFIETRDPISHFDVYVALSTISILLIGLSLFFLIYGFLVRQYAYPFEYRANKIRRYLTVSQSKLKDDLITRYGIAIADNREKNEKKGRSLRIATISLAVGVLFSLISPLALLWLKFLKF